MIIKTVEHITVQKMINQSVACPNPINDWYTYLSPVPTQYTQNVYIIILLFEQRSVITWQMLLCTKFKDGSDCIKIQERLCTRVNNRDQLQHRPASRLISIHQDQAAFLNLLSLRRPNIKLILFMYDTCYQTT